MLWLYLLHNHKIESMNVQKNIVLILIIALNFALNISCSSSDDTVDDTVEETTVSDWKCGTHNGNQLWTGPKGGCYYYNSNDNKTYVDRSECVCSK